MQDGYNLLSLSYPIFTTIGVGYLWSQREFLNKLKWCSENFFGLSGDEENYC